MRVATSSPDVSVVIPTFNRCERLRKVMQALGRQVVRTSGDDGRDFSFEVIVVSDGSTDGTVEMLATLTPDFELTVVDQLNSGPAAARNAGIEVASAPVVLFLDDDVFPEAGCIAAHVERHDSSDGLVVIGPMSTPPDADLSAWVAWEQHQLEKQYERFRSDPTAHARQFYTGNASVSRAALEQAGRFDTSYRRAEDVELARRLDEGGQRFVFEASAEAFHHAERSFESWYGIAYDYGQNDVEFARRGSPEVLGDIRGFFAERHVLQRSLVKAVLGRPRLRRVATACLRRGADLAVRCRVDTVGRQMLSALYGINYYLGVAEALGSPAAFFDLAAGQSHDSLQEDFVAWLVLEQTLGHVTHSKNLRSLMPQLENFDPHFLPVDDSLDGMWRRVPVWSNWTVRAGIRARRQLRRRFRGPGPRPDALFIHSQVPAVLLGSYMRNTPSVVSLDATPEQYDQLGDFYRHEVGSGPAERVKKWLNRRCYQTASHLVTWSDWAKQGLISGYGIDSDKITVIAPGVDVDLWRRPEGHVRSPGPLRVLFVGGDLVRKGGDLLIEVSQRLRHEPDIPDFEVHLATPAQVEPLDGIVVHHGLTANSAELIALYHDADIFCLPTMGDCLPMVLAEAGASGLPLISTDVGAIGGIVRTGDTGRLIDVGHDDQLAAALRALLTDDDERARAGRAARRLVEAEHDARQNAQLLAGVLRRAARSVDASSTQQGART